MTIFMTKTPSCDQGKRPLQDTVDLEGGLPAQRLLKELLSTSIVLAEDWDNLPDRVRAELSALIAKEQLIRALAHQQLLTPYQAARIEAGKTNALIFGNYRVLDRIGSGGMGVVFKGEHVRMRRTVAIKVLPQPEGMDNSLLRRFQREMRTLAQLQHPNVVSAIDDGETTPTFDDPRLYYFVMEYVPGTDLEDLITTKGPLPIDQACSLVYQVTSALAEAHAHNLVHRDIKPSNIRVTPDGQAKLLDFGLVRHFHHRVTEHGRVLGTPDYLSPEQARDASAVDIRADIYSLGGTLFWCLTGRVPFPVSGSAAEALIRRSNQKPPSLREVDPKLPAELDAVVQRMMACNPDDRYPTPDAVMNVLLGFLNTKVHAQTIPAGPTAKADALLKPLPKEGDNRSAHQVLVVDDSRMVRIFCTHALREEGHLCDQAENGLEALTAVGAKPYDLILTDWVMPGMTGLELCRRLRESSASPNLKIIVFSSQITDDDVAQVLAAGADDYLTGKFSPVQLRARVNAALRLKDAQDRSDLLNRHLLACNRQLEENLQSRDSDLVQVRNALVLGLTDLVCKRDIESIYHGMRVQRYSRTLAEEATGIPSLAAQIDRNFIQMLECCAPLHDIGKIGLPDYLLGKAGNLDIEERLIMETHTTIGAETLQNVAQRHGSAVAFLQMAIDIARHHHERFDGQGYPDRLAGNDIPLAARIVTVGDVYDSLRIRHAYKPALSHSATMQVMLESSSGQFDPLLLLAFQRCAPLFEQIYRDLPG